MKAAANDESPSKSPTTDHYCIKGPNTVKLMSIRSALTPIQYTVGKISINVALGGIRTRDLSFTAL